MNIRRIWDNLDDVFLYISFIGAALLIIVSQIVSISVDRKLDFILGIIATVATSMLLEKRRKIVKIKENTDSILGITSKLTGTQSLSQVLITRQGLPPARELLKNASRIAICGKSLVNFVRTNRLLIEEAAQRGCQFSFLLIDPDGKSAPMVVDSAVSEQNVEMFKSSVQTTIFNLDQIITKVGSDQVKYKFIDFLLPFSLFIIEHGNAANEIHVELYTYKTSSSFRPMFIVKEDQDKQLYRLFEKQFSYFWNM